MYTKKSRIEEDIDALTGSLYGTRSGSYEKSRTRKLVEKMLIVFAALAALSIFLALPLEVKIFLAVIVGVAFTWQRYEDRKAGK